MTDLKEKATKYAGEVHDRYAPTSHTWWKEVTSQAYEDGARDIIRKIEKAAVEGDLDYVMWELKLLVEVK